MQLSVPFLTIPVKKSVNSATGLMEVIIELYLIHLIYSENRFLRFSNDR